MDEQPRAPAMQSLSAEREWTVDGVPVLTASVSLPKPTNYENRAIRRISRFYRLQRHAYLRYCEVMLFPKAADAYRQAVANSGPLPSCSAALTYHVTYTGPNFWSLHTDSREQIGTQVEFLRRGDTWNLWNGYPVPLTDFFPRRYPIRKKLLKTAAEEIERQERAGVSRYHEYWRQELRRTFSRENFYLTAEDLCFFWQMHAVAPAVEGIPTFHIPFSKDGCRLPNPYKI